MSKITITTIEAEREVKSGDRAFKVYQVVGTDETGNHRAPEITFKPEIGRTYEGEFEKSQYGLKFKMAKQDGQFGSKMAYKRDPEVEQQIIRQNSLTNAVAYCTAKSGLMDKKDALKYLTGKEIIEVASYFARYSMGLISLSPKTGAATEENKVGSPLNKQDIDTTKEPEELNPEEIEKMFNDNQGFGTFKGD